MSVAAECLCDARSSAASQIESAVPEMVFNFESEWLEQSSSALIVKRPALWRHGLFTYCIIF
jgi:hypothetical protein